MCLLMWKPKDVVLTKRDVYDYYAYNRDGFGIMWHDASGRVRWYKMVGGKKATWRTYQQYAAGRDCALHWRMATAGAINVDMAHPFIVTERPAAQQIMLMHNGVLACRSTATRSDTAEFAAIMRRELVRHPERLDDESWLRALDDVIGPGNRLLFLRDGNPEPVIVGRDKGIEHNGAWYSNTYAWTNTYYDPNDWHRAWDWDEKDGTASLLTYASTVAAPVDLYDPTPVTAREIAAVKELEDWLDRYRYADIEETVDHFTDWYGRTDSERKRLQFVLESVAFGHTAIKHEVNYAAP